MFEELPPPKREMLGVGDERIVYEDPDDPEWVVIVPKEDTGDRELSPAEFEAKFYLTKIMHLLFPHNVPDVVVPESDRRQLKRKKINFDADHDAVRRLRLIREKGEEPPEELVLSARLAREKIERDANVTGLRDTMEAFGVDVDRAPQNFGYDVEGNMKYVEDFPALQMAASGPRPWFNADKIEQAIERLDAEPREQARMYLGRLKQLITEEVARLSSR